MSRFNLSDNIHARGRGLYLQTSNLDEGKIVSTLFDGGRVLAKEEQSHEADVSLEARVKQNHADRVDSIELLYNISTRVKTVRHPPSLLRLGRQFLRWNLLDEAISELELALQYDEKYGEVYLALGEAYLKRGGLEESADILKKGTGVAPGYADIWHMLGKACLANRQYEKSYEAFNQALKINASYAEAHFSMALCLATALSDEEAGSEFLKATDRFQKIREHLGRTVLEATQFQSSALEEVLRCLRQKNLDKTLKLLRKIESTLTKVIDLNFDDVFYLGLMYGEKGKDGPAIQDYVVKLESLAREFPDFPDLRNKLGIAILIQCRHLFNKALHQFREASTMNPDYEKAKNNLKLARNDGKGLIILLRAMLK